MEIGLAILLFICMTALLYVILSLKITRQVDLQMKEFYKTRIHQDMQEFYRDMEGYAAHFESQIQRLRTLSERAEAAPAPIVEPTPEVGPAPQAEKTSKAETRKKTPAKREPVRVEKNQKKSQPAKIAPLLKSSAKKSAPPAPQARTAPVQKPLPAVEATPVAARPPEHDDRRDDLRVSADPGASMHHDVAIAEELMKDLFQQDEVRLSARPQVAPAKTVAAHSVAPAETEGEKTMSNFFSRLGRAIEPVIFGEKSTPKPAQDLARSLVPEPEKMVSSAQSKATSNFSEVLKRAEQIKAEKKAQRERSEVEARAEFYAHGDSLVLQTGGPAQRNEAAAVVPPRLATPVREESRRNTLAVKDLDQHTINFLIDSLVQDNGYRKQALRALTENNIPLSEIARLSKIDIGELELMRQLGRF